MTDEFLIRQFFTKHTICPVPRTFRTSRDDRLGRNVNYRFDIPKHGIRYNWPEGAVGEEPRAKPICMRCKLTTGVEKVLEKDTGDFCLDCIHFAREWSPSWCWFVGEPGHRLPNGQCDQHVDTSQATWTKGACPLHDQWQYDSDGKVVLDHNTLVRKEEFERDDKGDFVLQGGQQVVRNGVVGMEGGSKVRIRSLWPATLKLWEHSGSWYAGRDQFSNLLDYPCDYEWANYSRYR